MQFLTRRHLSRRALLRGAGVAIALPFLDAMVPAQTALAQTSANAPLRVGFCYVPHGALIDNWTLAGNLRPLTNVQDQVAIVSGLDLRSADGHGSTPPAFLSDGSTTTLDQILADRIGGQTALRSLALGTEDASDLAGAWDTGYDPASVATISWRSRNEPVPVEINPRAVFIRMFGQGNRGVLDEVVEDTTRLRNQLGASDRSRVSAYLDSVREVERRIDTADGHAEHIQLMFDLMALAYEADITRIQTFMLAREVSYRAFPELGITEGFHTLSHHQFDPIRVEQLIRINTWHVSQMARFLERLKSTPDGDGTLLDHSLLLYGSGMGLANSHQHTDLPIFLAGGANGQLKGNRHLRYADGAPLANLLLSIGNMAEARGD